MSTLTVDDFRRAALEGGHIVCRFSGQVARVVNVHRSGLSEPPNYRVTIQWGGSQGRYTYGVDDLRFGARLLPPIEALALAEQLGEGIEFSPEAVYIRSHLGDHKNASPLNVKDDGIT